MSKKVLVVDDDVILCELFATGFKLAGFEVDIVHNGNDALQYLSQNEVSVITLDNDMPGMSGLQVLQEFQSNEKTSAKVVMVTANDSIRDNPIYRELADYILIKPIGFRQLTQVVQSLVAAT